MTQKDMMLDNAMQEFNVCIMKHSQTVKNSLYTIVGHAYNEGYKEGIKQVKSTEIEEEQDEWMEHHIQVEGYGKVYYQHTCRPVLLENPYHFCPFCGKKMKSKDINRGE